MNILVISDKFLKGGLENNILTFWDTLRGEDVFYFCFSQFEDNHRLDKDRVYCGFHFTFDETVGELKEDVERLVDIIREHEIDVIHVHPWYGLYAAYFASAITGTKMVYTYHGTASVNYNNNLFDEIFMQEILTSAVSHVFSVSRQGIRALAGIGCQDTSLLRNPVHADMVSAGVAGSGKWALVSRLDEDKADTLELFFSVLPQLNIKAVDVYGRGNVEERLRESAAQAGKDVVFMGHEENVPARISAGGYDGVIGLGRCAVEGLMVGLPVLLAGYGRLAGLVDRDIYRVARETNFTTEDIKGDSIEEINAKIDMLYKDPTPFLFRDRCLEDFDSKVLSAQYHETLQAAELRRPHYVVELYKKLIGFADAGEQLHTSGVTYSLFCDYIFPRTCNLHVRDLIMQERRRQETEQQLRQMYEQSLKGLNSESNSNAI